MHCSPPRVLTDSGCIPIYREVEGFALELYLKMKIAVPTNILNPFILPLLDKRLNTLTNELNFDTTCVMTVYAGSENSHNATMVSGKKTYDFFLLHILGIMTTIHNTDTLLKHTVAYPYGHMASMMEGYFVNADLDSTSYDLSTLDTISEYLEDFPKSECDKRPLRITLQSNCLQVRLENDEFQYNNENYACVKGTKFGHCFSHKEYTILANGSIAICSEDYLAMIDMGSKTDMTENWVSLICTCVSVLCLIITLITYCVFDELRSLHGKLNMALAISLMCAQLFFQFGLNGSTDQVVCSILGVLVHFLWLLTIFWMNVCCIQMLRVFLSIKNNLAPSTTHTRIVLTYTTYCVLMAILFVLVNVTYSFVTTDKQLWGYGGAVCYITTSKMIGFTFALPVGLVVMSNLTMFFVVVYSIQNLPDIKRRTQNQRNNLIIYVKLSSVTGAAWIFGFVYQWTGVTALVYVFIVLNCCQGVFIMLSFVCNRRVKHLYSNRFSKEQSDGSTGTDETRM